MAKTDAELIEELKKPELARPLMYRTSDEKRILDAAGRDNLLYLNTLMGTWLDATSGTFPGRVYILKSDYQPEPEYDEYVVSRYATFAGFKDCDTGEIFYITGEVATRMREGHKIVARFRKEGE